MMDVTVIPRKKSDIQIAIHILAGVEKEIGYFFIEKLDDVEEVFNTFHPLKIMNFPHLLTFLRNNLRATAMF